MATRLTNRIGFLVVAGFLCQAGTASGSEYSDDPGKRMPPTYNPATGGAMPMSQAYDDVDGYGKIQRKGSGTGNPADPQQSSDPLKGLNVHKAHHSAKREGSGTGNPGGHKEVDGSGDPLKGLNVHKSSSSEDKTPKCHEPGISLYGPC